MFGLNWSYRKNKHNISRCYFLLFKMISCRPGCKFITVCHALLENNIIFKKGLVQMLFPNIDCWILKILSVDNTFKAIIH